jgi:hypothetical protein
MFLGFIVVSSHRVLWHTGEASVSRPVGGRPTALVGPR